MMTDITPPSDQLESMDMHMLNHQLVNFMQQVLENMDQSFYQNNTESTNNFSPDLPTLGVPSIPCLPWLPWR
jgi:hypothetical protein